MKKIFTLSFLLLLAFMSIGCTDNNEPSKEPQYGEYDVEKMYSKYPMYVNYNEDTNSRPVFSFNHTFKPGVFSNVVDLEDIECESLAELFSFNGSDEYLIGNYCALSFIRVESMCADELDNISFYDLFIENGKIYVTLSYNDYPSMGDTALSYFQELILIPKEWAEKLETICNFNINYNKRYNSPKLKDFNIMSYSKMQEYKNAFREKVLSEFDDQKYREIYMLDVYGEYSGCLVATADYDEYIHCDDDRYVTETIEDISITYNYYYPIWVCRDSKLYTLTEAYNNGYLTKDDIYEISVRFTIKHN